MRCNDCNKFVSFGEPEVEVGVWKFLAYLDEVFNPLEEDYYSGARYLSDNAVDFWRAPALSGKMSGEESQAGRLMDGAL